MIITKRLLAIRHEQDVRKDKVFKQNREAYDKLNIINRIRLDRINNLIYTITNRIVEESGWTYTPGYFSLLSDYRHGISCDIEFNLNRVNSNENGYYVTDKSSKYEKEFFERYQGLLKRLFNLEQKRKALVLPHIDTFPEGVIDFKDLQQRKKEQQDIDKEFDFLKTANLEFYEEYGKDGIQRLVNLLNDLTTSTDLMKTFNEQFKGNITRLYLKELYRWAGSFTPRAEQTIGILERKRRENEELLTDELRELIR